MSNLSLSKILNLSPEEMEDMSLAELAELHNICKESKQVKAKRKADIIGAILSRKTKEAKQAEPVENSKKILKPKGAGKKPSKKQDGEQEQLPLEEAPEQPVSDEKKPRQPKKQDEQPKQEQPKKEQEKKKASFKKKDAEQKADLTKMTQEQLIEYAKTLEEKVETFPEKFKGSKFDYIRTNKFETVDDFTQHIAERPYTIYMFLEETAEDGNKMFTQMQLLYASDTVFIFIDKNNDKDSTLSVKPEQFKGTFIDFGKQGKFNYAFYTKEPKQEQQEQTDEKSA